MSNPRRRYRHHADLLVWGLAVILACILPTCAASADASWLAQPYRLGQGLYFPQQSLRVGGYADIHFYSLGQHPTALSVEDLSLFLSKDIGTHWKLFSETELGDALVIDSQHATTKDANIDVERLYADYHTSSGITLRFGKFLTPVGQWNLVHADPLVWTVSRPLTTTGSFSRHASGAMLYGTVSLKQNDLDYWLFADDSKAFAFTRSHNLAFTDYGASSTLRNDFQHAVGGQFLYHMLDDRLSLGASYVRYALKNPQQQYRLTGIDFGWSSRRVEFSGEGIWRTSDSPLIPDEYGGYVQAVIPLPRHLYAVGRYERYRNSLPNQWVTLRTFGIDYRPESGISFKLEYRDGNNNAALAPNGVLASIGVLF